MISIFDRHGDLVSTSRNLRGIRQAVGKNRVDYVLLKKRPNHEGSLYIAFLNGNRCLIGFASYDVLKQTIRNWRNLYGVDLYADREYQGKVEYGNPALFPASHSRPRMLF